MAVSVRKFICAVSATIALAAIAPAAALAGESKADLDRDKVADDLEGLMAPLDENRELRLLVSLSGDATASRVGALEQAVGDMDVEERFSVVDVVALRATKKQVRALAREGVVTRVERDAPVAASSSDDGRAGIRNESAQQSFGVQEARLDAPLLDGNADADPAVYSPLDLVAAVLDTGIDVAHRDLPATKVLGFKDFVNGRLTPYDDEGHGTHVAATVAGDGGDDPRYRGVAPGAGLVGVKVLDEEGDGFTSDVVAGIQWVIENKDIYGIEAINLSLGTQGCGDGFGADSQAVDEAHEAGLVVAVAAGNEGPGTCTIGSPGDAKDALTVGAMADLGAHGFKQADFSSRGPTADGRVKPDVSAPGVDITSAQAGTLGGYVALNGTSMATPFVTGLALLMLDANPSYGNDSVKAAIKSSAIDWGRGGSNATAGTLGADIDYGAGRLDAYAALVTAGAPLTSPPSLPSHALREGSLSGTGQGLDYTVDIADTTIPFAATMIQVPTGCRTGADPDFDLKLISPGGAVVASASEAERQDEFGYVAPTPGVYTLRVFSFRDCGDFFIDVSGGSVSAEGMFRPEPPTTPGTPPAPPPSDPQPAPLPPPTPPSGNPVASTALADAARLNARRATAALRRARLRGMLRRRSFSLSASVPSAGRVEVAVRMTHRRKKLLVARTIQRVTAAGQKKLTVRLTASGRRLLARLGLARLTVRAAVTDSSGRRRYADRGVSVRR